MSELFVEDDELLEETFQEEKIKLNPSESTVIDARRRLEKLLDDKILQKELEDYLDE